MKGCGKWDMKVTGHAEMKGIIRTETRDLTTNKFITRLVRVNLAEPIAGEEHIVQLVVSVEVKGENLPKLQADIWVSTWVNVQRLCLNRAIVWRGNDNRCRMFTSEDKKWCRTTIAVLPEVIVDIWVVCAAR